MRTFDVTAPNLEVRIGAILALERTARDNPGDHICVMEILCAYVRENAPARRVSEHGHRYVAPTPSAGMPVHRSRSLSYHPPAGAA